MTTSTMKFESQLWLQVLNDGTVLRNVPPPGVTVETQPHLAQFAQMPKADD
jgi:hypothetical protein